MTLRNRFESRWQMTASCLKTINVSSKKSSISILSWSCESTFYVLHLFLLQGQWPIECWLNFNETTHQLTADKYVHENRAPNGVLHLPFRWKSTSIPARETKLHIIVQFQLWNLKPEVSNVIFSSSSFSRRKKANQIEAPAQLLAIKQRHLVSTHQLKTRGR